VPGKHFADNSPYQFIEAEYMLEDEYDSPGQPLGLVVRKMMRDGRDPSTA